MATTTETKTTRTNPTIYRVILTETYKGGDYKVCHENKRYDYLYGRDGILKEVWLMLPPDRIMVHIFNPDRSMKGRIEYIFGARMSEYGGIKRNLPDEEVITIFYDQEGKMLALYNFYVEQRELLGASEDKIRLHVDKETENVIKVDYGW